MSDINWMVVFIGVVVMGGSIAYLMSPPSKKKPAPKPAPKTSTGPARLTVKKELKSYSLEEVSKHSKRSDCWIIVDKCVYDVTSYIDEHPGGESIMNNAGGDASEGVHGPQHPPSMWDVLALYKIGTLAA